MLYLVVKNLIRAKGGCFAYKLRLKMRSILLSKKRDEFYYYL